MKFIVLTGPTAVGKTKISIELAKRLNTEIISSDSMQIYKFMDIGTAKVTDSETDGIVHHLIDIINPNEEFTVEDFYSRASEIIVDLNNKGKIPIITGGTGLYIDALLYALDFGNSQKDEKLRLEYENLAKEYGNKFVYDLLLNIDPETANKYHPNQLQRIIRALEIFDQTGEILSRKNNLRAYRDGIEFIYLVLNRDREILYDRINQRVDQMIDLGLVKEVENLIQMGFFGDLKPMQAIGYKETLEYMQGKTDLEEYKSTLKQNSRRYAKRQLTWFRRQNEKFVIGLDGKNEDEVINICLELINGEFNGKY